MKDMNRIFLMGRLGSDADLKETKTGKKVLKFSMATGKTFKKRDENGQESDEKLKSAPQWHQVVIWGKLGEACAPYLKKGKPVFVEGEVRSKKYMTKDGFERWTYEVNAKEINFLPSLSYSANHVPN